jgi:hypothetical protein
VKITETSAIQPIYTQHQHPETGSTLKSLDLFDNTEKFALIQLLRVEPDVRIEVSKIFLELITHPYIGFLVSVSMCVHYKTALEFYALVTATNEGSTAFIR